MLSSTRSIRTITRILSKQIHTSTSLKATTELTMPALSPTMTEGSITEWKFKVGESFTAGEVLLQIETDKASIEVEAQDDGIMGMILVQNDTSGVQVGAIIALLIEEGDDISLLKAPSPSTPSPPTPTPAPTPTPIASIPTPSPPASKSTSTPTPSPSPPTPTQTSSPIPTPTPTPASSSSTQIHPYHPLPLLPSVNRLLILNKIQDASIIKSTGSKGLLTKGDVLAFLGRIKLPLEKEVKVQDKVLGGEKGVEKRMVELDGEGFRRLIAGGLGEKKLTKREVVVPAFDDILDEYLPLSMRSKRSLPKKIVVESIPSSKSLNSLDSFF